MSRSEGDRTHAGSISSGREAAVGTICEEFVDDVILGVCFEVHRAVKMGTFFLDEMDETSEKDYEIVDEMGLDVFGQVPMKKQLECVCPNCQRNLAASRFAPHLEKCMGMGRSSSRIANRRIANSGKDAGSDDDDNDDDWTYNTDRKGAKKKREKSNHSPRRSKSSKSKNGDGSSVASIPADTGSSLTSYEIMSIDERKGLLKQMCGVILKTNKMCTRSQRCPQHTDEQRKAVRLFLLSQPGTILQIPDDIQIDIDSCNDIDSQILQDPLGNLWDAGTTGNPSPTDSNSTNNSSTSSKKREKKPKSGNASNRGKKSTVGSANNAKVKSHGSSTASAAPSSGNHGGPYDVT